MSCSKLSTTKIPISARLKIPKDKLLNVRQEETWAFETGYFEIEELSGVTYCFRFISTVPPPDTIYSGQCSFALLHVRSTKRLKMNVDYEVSIPSANYANKFGDNGQKEDYYCTSYIVPTNELFDPAKNFIVNDNLIVKMEAVLSVQKEEIRTAGSDSEASNCCECNFASTMLSFGCLWRWPWW